jgi:hypothetical protein
MLEDILKQNMVNRNQNFANIYPDRPVPVKKGQHIGFSGDTGFGYPHLHFELRDGKNQYTINPLKYININDTTFPEITKIYVEPSDINSFVNFSSIKSELKINKVKDGFYVSDKKMSFVPGSTIKFSAEAFDQTEKGSNNKLGLYSIELVVDTKKHYEVKFDTLPINDRFYAERHFNYSQTNLGPTVYSYRLYNPKTSQGKVTLDKNISSVKIILGDYAGNKSVVLIDMEPVERFNPVNEISYELSKEMTVNKTVYYSENKIGIAIKPSLNLRTEPELKIGDTVYPSFFNNNQFFFSIPYLNFPETDLILTDFAGRNFVKPIKLDCAMIYNGVKFDDFIIKGDKNIYMGFSTAKNECAKTKTLNIFPENKYMENFYEIKTANNSFDSYSSFYSYNNITKRWNFLKSERIQGVLSTKTNKTGSFAVLEDKTPPEINMAYKGKNVVINLSDDLSGLNSDTLNLYLNGKKLLFHYDITRQRINLSLPDDENEFTTLEISVRDNQGNISTKKEIW